MGEPESVGAERMQAHAEVIESVARGMFQSWDGATRTEHGALGRSRLIVATAGTLASVKVSFKID